MKTRGLIILYIMMVWFVISFVTNLIGPLMPVIIDDFHLIASPTEPRGAFG